MGSCGRLGRRRYSREGRNYSGVWGLYKAWSNLAGSVLTGLNFKHNAAWVSPNFGSNTEEDHKEPYAPHIERNILEEKDATDKAYIVTCRAGSVGSANVEDIS